ncbi:hypothetical protein GEMRC1_007411 [Eukaryota sp. GEM-RC1]
MSPPKPQTAGSTIDIGIEELSNVVIDFAEVSPDTYTVSPKTILAGKKDRDELLQIKDANVRKFYLQQNLECDALVEAHDVCHRRSSASQPPVLESGGVAATKVSLIANVVLLFIKVFVFYVSGSLSIFASVLDSVLDLLSGAILAITTKISHNPDRFKYPAGKTRAEPLGVIVFATLMGIVSVQIIVEAVSQLIDGDIEVNFDLINIGLMGIVVLIKLILYFYCKRVKDSSAADALAQDHGNDVMTNIFGTGCAYLSTILHGWIDPAGAILFSVYILYNWMKTLFEQITVMMGKVASADLIKRVTLVAVNHDPRILQLCTVRAFHFGSNVFVEVDIVLSPKMILEEAHEIGESLQNKLEMLKEVERAFVHIDVCAYHAVEDEHAVIV